METDAHTPTTLAGNGDCPPVTAKALDVERKPFHGSPLVEKPKVGLPEAGHTKGL